jgi:hypothetical protein
MKQGTIAQQMVPGLKQTIDPIRRFPVYWIHTAEPFRPKLCDRQSMLSDRVHASNKRRVHYHHGR